MISQMDESCNIVAYNEMYNKSIGVFDFGCGICDIRLANISKFVENDVKPGASM